MKTTRPLLILGSCLLVTACSQTSRAPLLEQDSRCPATLELGQTLTLSLPSNPTTGFRWDIRESADKVLRSLGPEVYRTPEAAGIVGAGGVSSWRFTAHSRGEDRLLLTYQQPWEPHAKPAQTFDCVIRVK